jgi:hypothetical protein
MQAENPRVKTRKIPTGMGGELNKAMLENLVRFKKVKNKVILVNPKLNLPFKIEELGLFAQSTLSEKTHPFESGQHWIEAWSAHGRSAFVARIIVDDGIRDIDIKGGGYVYGGNSILEPGKPRIDGEEYFGLREKKVAIEEHRLSEEFHNAGIRTARILAIMELEEIIVGGQPIPLKEAREKWGLMDNKFQPVIEVRAFGTKARIMDVIDILDFNGVISGFEKEKKNLLIEDAKKLVSQETGENLMSNINYLEWFASTLGQNLGLMHKNGWVHHGLNSHNITLDCKIVDLDEVTIIDKSNPDFDEISKDVSRALGTFSELTRALGVGGSRFLELREQFFKNYNKNFPIEQRGNFEN